MATYPQIEYTKRDGASVTMRLPDSVDLWDFLAWMDKKFMGITDEQLEKSRVEDLAMAQLLTRSKRK